MNYQPENLLDLVKNKSLLEVVFYYWLGRWPEEKERLILEEMMILAIDHGPDSPSAIATRGAAEQGKDLLRSVEAGVHEINQQHGGAIEGLARILQTDNRSEAEIVAQYLREGKRLPGFGHRIYTDVDPRAEYLFSRLQVLGFSDQYVSKVHNLASELEKQKGKKLVINIDGAMATILSELGIKPKLCNAFFLWPRVAGLVFRSIIPA